MFVRLLLLFTLVPVVELYVLIKIGQLIGAPSAILLVITTGVLGAYLAKREGLRVWYRIRQNLQQGISPADELLNGLLILLAGVVLITPGLLTDLIGFGLLIPPIRAWFKRRLAQHYREQVTLVTSGSPMRTVEYEVIDVPRSPHGGSSGGL